MHTPKKEPKKHKVFTMVDRTGESFSYRIANVTAKTLRPLIVSVVSRKSHLMTDEALCYVQLGEEFALHSTVNHADNEYVRGSNALQDAECACRASKNGSPICPR